MLGIHQQIARQAHYSLVRPATGGWRQFHSCLIRNVYANHGKIPIGKLPNVGTPIAANAFGTVGVRVWSDSTPEFNGRAHNDATFGQSRKKRKN